MIVQQILLSGKGHSGRGVRFRQLSPAEVDAANRSAARMVTKESLGVEYNQAVIKEIVERALIAATKDSGFTAMDQVLALPKTGWVALSPGELAMPEGPTAFSTLFTAKDDHVLCSILSRLHVAREDEIEAIMGKALMVSED